SEYIRNLSQDIFHFFHSKVHNIRLKLELDEIFLNIETAIPCGLIINELVTNSLKHAFSPEDKGEITLKLFKDDEKIVLIVKDNGIGLPPGIEMNNTETFGLQLVYFLNKRINGDIKLDTTQGTSFKICFEELNYEGRSANGE
ncbi:MAG: sensor histidine kinase, partial [Methanobacterium sp.]|nr:sensor histidine kinase [Methanobacterium sp.]